MRYLLAVLVTLALAAGESQAQRFVVRGRGFVGPAWGAPAWGGWGSPWGGGFVAGGFAQPAWGGFSGGWGSPWGGGFVSPGFVQPAVTLPAWGGGWGGGWGRPGFYGRVRIRGRIGW